MAAKIEKALEQVLNDKAASYRSKVVSLIEVWKQVSQCRLGEEKKYVVHLMDWLKLHTLNVVLTGEWRTLKGEFEAKLLAEVKHCERLLITCNSIFSLRCRKLADVISNPWGSDVLWRLMRVQGLTVGQEEIDFFCNETGYLISTRLRKLCESQCEDLALNLVTSFKQCYEMTRNQRHSLNTTEDQKRFITDVHIALLYRYQKTSLIIETLKSLTLQEGLKLLKRFAHKRVNISKIWKHSNSIAHLAAQVYVTAALMKPPEESVYILEALLDTWFSLTEATGNLDSLVTAVRRIIQAADSTIHMYVFCEVIHQKFGHDMKTFIIELYIRTLTAGMNELERQKNEEDTSKVGETTRRLACGFLRLADILDEHVKVCRECVLTSFSLQPTEATLNRIIQLAERSGYEVLDTGQNWKCKLHPPVTASDEICWKCEECGDYMSQPQFEKLSNTNTVLNDALNAEHLGLSTQLCDDLVVLLCCPRYQLFNWLLRWQDLHRLCVLYLNDPERTKNFITELKFVEIDYTMFMGMKREPEDELAGIERGYEQYLEEELYREVVSDKPCIQTVVSDDGVKPIKLMPPPRNSRKSMKTKTKNNNNKPKNPRKSTRARTVTSTVTITTATMSFSATPNGEISTVASSDMSSESAVRTANSQETSMKSKGIAELDLAVNKSLRFFRPSLKRTKTPDEHELPSKVFVTSTPMSPLATANSSILNAQDRMSLGMDRKVPSQMLIDRAPSPIIATGEGPLRAFTNRSRPPVYCDQTGYIDSRYPLPMGMINQSSCRNVSSSLGSATNPAGFIDARYNAIPMGIEREEPLRTSSDRLLPQIPYPQSTFMNSHYTHPAGMESSSSRNYMDKPHSPNMYSGISNNYLDESFSPTSTIHSGSSDGCYPSFSDMGNDSPPGSCTGRTCSPGVLEQRYNEYPSSMLLNRESPRQTPGKTKFSSPNFFEKEPASRSVYPSNDYYSYPEGQYIPDRFSRNSMSSSLAAPHNVYSNTFYNIPSNIENQLSQDDSLYTIPPHMDWRPTTVNTNNSFSHHSAAETRYANAHHYNSPLNMEVVPSRIVHDFGDVNVSTSRNFKNRDRQRRSSNLLNKRHEPAKASKSAASVTTIDLTKEKGKRKNKRTNITIDLTEDDDNNNEEDKIIIREFIPLMANSANERTELIIVTEHSRPRNADNVSKLCTEVVEIQEEVQEEPKKVINTAKNSETDLDKTAEEQNSLNSDVSLNSKNLLSSSTEVNVKSELLSPIVDSSENQCDNEENVPISINVSKNELETSKGVEEEQQNNSDTLKEDKSKNLNGKSNAAELLKKFLSDTVPTKTVKKEIAQKPIGSIEKPKNESTARNFSKNDKHHYLRKPKSTDHELSQEKRKDTINNKNNIKGDIHTKSHETASLKGDKLIDHLIKKFNIIHCYVVAKKLTQTECREKKLNLNENKRKSTKSVSKTTRAVVPKRKSKRGKKKPQKKSENKTKCKRKGKSDANNKNKNGSKPWPLQDINPKVNRHKDTKSNTFKGENCRIDFKTDLTNMNPYVVLKRIEFDQRSANSILANVPGLNDLQMIRPSSVDRIVQVVQVPGVRSTTSVPVQSTQTSTQVTPHIQRIGQPRAEKPEPTSSDSSTTTHTAATSTITSTTAADSPTLINILSQQIIRPGNQGNCMSVKPRASPLINILSQQIIKPATNVAPTAKVPSSGSTEVQVNSLPRVISGGDQILSQLINPVRAPAPTLKTLVSAPASDQNRIVQFICKSSDGKLIPVTSFTSNKVVKVSMTQTVSSSVPGSTSVADENFTKLAQTTPKTKTDATENSDSLPKFQQAFGKPAYQNNIDSSECVTANSDNVNSDLEKTAVVKSQPKNSSTSLNVQPVQGGVIYTRQMPVGQTINLIPPGRGQVFRIATSNAEQLSLVKDTVIHGKMSALLAAALQGKQRTLDSELDITPEENSQTNTRVALTTRPTLVQNARIVKPVLQIPSNVIRSAPQSNLSSTTLEQLREFDMVYKQVKERSSTSAPTESSPQSDSNEQTQQISVTYLNQGQKINCAPVVVVSNYCNVQPAASPALSVTSQGSSSPCVTPAPTLALSKTASKSPKTKSVKSATTHTTKASPIPKPQQKPQEDEHTTQRIFDILAEYAEQLRNSPDLNNKPAPRRRSNPPTNPNQNAKRKKSSSSKKTGHCSNSLASDGDMEDAHTVGSEDSSCGVVQISVQEEEQPLTTVTTSETSEASVSPKQLILTDSTPNQSRSLIIADSNVGEALKMSNTAVLVPGNYIMPVSMVKGGQQIAVVSGGSKILATVPARSGPNMLLFQSFLNQTRKHGLPTVKYSAVQPISGISRSISAVPPQAPQSTPPTSQNLTAVTLAQTVALQKINQLDRSDINSFDTELLLTIAHPSENKGITEQPQLEHRGISSNENVQTIRVGDNILNSESSPEKNFTYEEKSLVNTSVATSVIAQSISIKEKLSEEQPTTARTIMALNLNSSDNDKDTTIKVEGRVQSVLVATGTSNGPMLSHSPPTYNKQTESTNSISESNKDEYLRNEGKRNNTETKSLQSSVYAAFQGKLKKNQVSSHRLDRELQQLSLQRKQAALERELRLQKSLSEECEDLGVDEPSTSDLFPEADLLFDSNHSPSFDHSSQDLVKRAPNTQEAKEETKTIGLFCDDEPMRIDCLFEPIAFQSAGIGIRDMTNGQGSTSNESGLSCEDNTLLQTCTSMSDVTIPSPISPDPYADSSPPPLNKCKFKYINRKKVERSKQVENWPVESSSDDTTGSMELKSCSRSPEIYLGKRNQNLSCDDQLFGFTIERLPLKEDEDCEDEEIVDCPSGRGARRSVKKLCCTCCTGSTNVARKRPASRPPTPFAHKKTVIAKKR